MKITKIREQALQSINQLTEKVKNAETFDLEKKEILGTYVLVIKAFKRTKIIFELEKLGWDMVLAGGSVYNLETEMQKIYNLLTKNQQLTKKL